MHAQNLRCSAVLAHFPWWICYFWESSGSVSWKKLLFTWGWLHALLITCGDLQWAISCSGHLYSNLLIWDRVHRELSLRQQSGTYLLFRIHCPGLLAWILACCELGNCCDHHSYPVLWCRLSLQLPSPQPTLKSQANISGCLQLSVTCFNLSSGLWTTFLSGPLGFVGANL